MNMKCGLFFTDGAVSWFDFSTVFVMWSYDFQSGKTLSCKRKLCSYFPFCDCVEKI